MLKQISIKRIVLASIILLLLFLFCLFPQTEEYDLNLNLDNSVEYVSSNFEHSIYLLDSDNYIAKTNVLLKEKKIENKTKEILDYLIIDGKKESNIPNGFRSMIPSDTKILGISFKDGIVKIDFSKEFLSSKKDLEEKIIEAIVYSVTTLKEVKGVLLYVEGEFLNTLPKTGKQLPSILKRDYGVNKVYDIQKITDISSVTTYYINKHNDNYYYVPVTKYTNDNREKIKIIIEELTSGPIYETNLMSFLNVNAKLLDYKLEEAKLKLNFNHYLFDDIDEKDILEEVIYTIALSVGDNYQVKEVIFMVNEEEIEKTVLKIIE